MGESVYVGLKCCRNSHREPVHETFAPPALSELAPLSPPSCHLSFHPSILPWRHLVLSSGVVRGVVTLSIMVNLVTVAAHALLDRYVHRAGNANGPSDFWSARVSLDRSRRLQGQGSYSLAIMLLVLSLPGFPSRSNLVSVTEPARGNFAHPAPGTWVLAAHVRSFPTSAHRLAAPLSHFGGLSGG
ncbi:hypothetical protein EDB80DRAFT_138297 [Ilyonectria destructans]|nr:hypothetical protein EDB80DRAFT_138297 [Ilyonectria destructans]